MGSDTFERVGAGAALRSRSWNLKRRLPSSIGVVLLLALTPGPATAQAPAPGSSQESAPGPVPPKAPASPAPPAAEPTPGPAAPSSVPPVPRPGDVSPTAPYRLGPPPPTVPAGPLGPAPAVPLPGAPAPSTTFRLGANVAISEEYTDNFEQLPTAEENFRTTLAPSVRLEIDRGPTAGALHYTLSGAHDTIDDEISFFHLVRGLFEWHATPRLRLAASEIFTTSDRAQNADRLSLRRGREEFTSNTLTLESQYTLPTFTTRQYYQFHTFETDADTAEEGADDEDTTTHTFGASVGVTLARINAVTLGYEYLVGDVDDGDITGHRVTSSVARAFDAFVVGLSGSYAIRNLSPGNDYDLWNVSAFGSYSIPLPLGTWTATGSAGYNVVESDDPADDESSPGFTLGLSYASGRFVASVVGEQGFSETFVEAGNRGVVKTRGVTASIAFPIAVPVTATLRGFYRHNEFTGLADSDGGGTTEVVGAAATVAVQLARWLELILEYEYTDRSSTRDVVPPDEYTENRGLVALRTLF